jgi:hypothetical protein
VAELEQFTLDPFVPPGVILPRKALDQCGGLGTERRSAGAVWVGPFPGDQTAVSSQHNARVTSRCARRFLGSSRMSAASTARSARSNWGLGVGSA